MEQGSNDIVMFDGDIGYFYGSSVGDMYVGGNVAYRVFPLDVDSPDKLGVDATMHSNASMNAERYTLRVEMEDDQATVAVSDSTYNISSGNQMEYLSSPLQPWTNRVAVSEEQLTRKLKVRFTLNNTLSRRIKIQMLPNMQVIPSDESWNRFFSK